MALSPADTSTPPASWENEDRRSDISRVPHPLLLLIPLHLCYLLLPLLLSIAIALLRISLLQACPTHPRLYIFIASHHALGILSLRRRTSLR